MTRKLTVDEAIRRMPAVELIEDTQLRMRTIEQIRRLPGYFWHAPATSSSSYHNRFGRGECGLWIHVLMGATALERCIDSYVAQGIVEDHGADYARAAILLHDGRKYGDEWRQGQPADKDHDLQMAQVLEDAGFPQEVVGAVAAHMGAWYEGPSPSTPLEQAVHQADMIASARHVTPAVYDPPPQLVAKYPDLPRCSPDDDAPQMGIGAEWAMEGDAES